MTVYLYDPLTYENLMAGVIVQFEKQAMMPVRAISDVDGPGVYALFYSGPMPAYEPISGSAAPIYVGKAVPPGSRKGSDVNEESPALRSRIAAHSRSIDAATNLELSDFSFRCLAMKHVWITLAERFLVDHYKPVWNLCLDGFGNNPQGRRREEGYRSRWDTMHPGREWAEKLRPRAENEKEQAREKARELVASFFRGRV